MTAEEVKKYWLQGAVDAYETANVLMKSKKFHFALFFCHLAMEKTLKAHVVSATNNAPLPIHDLVRLAAAARIKLSNTHRKQLGEINTFNIQARYDDYKRKFFNKATQQYATEWFSITKELLAWLKSK